MRPFWFLGKNGELCANNLTLSLGSTFSIWFRWILNQFSKSWWSGQKRQSARTFSGSISWLSRLLSLRTSRPCSVSPSEFSGRPRPRPNSRPVTSINSAFSRLYKRLLTTCLLLWKIAAIWVTVNILCSAIHSRVLQSFSFSLNDIINIRISY